MCKFVYSIRTSSTLKKELQGYSSLTGACPSFVSHSAARLTAISSQRSSSMGSSTKTPLPSTPATRKITLRHNNRLGAVYLSLHGFWHSRQTALGAAGSAQTPARRDAYSVILFNSHVSRCIENDFQQAPDQLLDQLLSNQASSGTNYTAAIRETEVVMRKYWSGERSVFAFSSEAQTELP